MKNTLKRIFVILFVLALVACTFFACSPREELPEDEPKKNGNKGNADLSKWEDLINSLLNKNNKPEFLKKDDYEYGEDIEITYLSQVTGANKHAMITLPHDYDESKQYPVLYLLHGMSCNHKSWLNQCNAKYIVQNLHYDENVKDILIVSVNSIVTEDEKAPDVSTEEYAAAFDKTGEDIVTSLMPYVNEHYSTLSDRQNTAIAGFSMGGRETLLTAFKYQDKFAYVGAFSSAGFSSKVISFSSSVPDFKTDDGVSFDYLMLAIGTTDNFTPHVTVAIGERFEQNGIAYVKKTYNGGHDYFVWKCALYDFVKTVFQNETEPTQAE